MPGSASQGTPSDLYIGLMSGTSMDGLDMALVAVGPARFEVLGTMVVALDPDLRVSMLELCQSGHDELHRLAQADTRFAEFCGNAVLHAIAGWGVDTRAVKAIGSHGQTVRHAPSAQPAYSVQLGNPSVLAERTGITTVADFRARDIAAGGEGAPLVPAFHASVFRDSATDRAVVNIGGMANVTLLPADAGAPVTGFDTGPGNVLMDLWCQAERGSPYDEDGAFARSGNLSHDLLPTLAAEPFFRRQPPKSTGRELFNGEWLRARAPAISDLPPEDVANTLTELTATTITEAIRSSDLKGPEILVCGGGHRNAFLMERLAQLASPSTVASTTAKGIDADFVEACAFAWLAWRALSHEPGNLPAVTGATGPRILGGIYPA